MQIVKPVTNSARCDYQTNSFYISGDKFNIKITGMSNVRYKNQFNLLIIPTFKSAEQNKI